MLIKNSRIIYFIIVILFLAISCNRKKESVDIIYGIKFNDVRKGIGLIPLKNNWMHSPIKDDGKIWWHDLNIDSAKIIKKAYSDTKMTLVRGDTLISETDTFISPEVYENDYGKYNVRLSYTYLFVADEGFSPGWIYYFSAKNYNKNISKNEADSILSSWGLSYP